MSRNVEYEFVGKLALPSSVSASFSNLCCERVGQKETCFAAIHKSTVNVISCDLSCIPKKISSVWSAKCTEYIAPETGKSAASTNQSKRRGEPVLVHQARFFTTNKGLLLVAAAARCVQFFAGDSHNLIYSHSLKQESDENEPFACGITLNETKEAHFIYVGTSYGEVLAFRVDEYVSKRQMRVQLVAATKAEHRSPITGIESVRLGNEAMGKSSSNSTSNRAVGLVSADESGVILFWLTRVTSRSDNASEEEISVKLKSTLVATDSGVPCCALTAMSTGVSSDAVKFAAGGFADGHVRIYELDSSPDASEDSPRNAMIAEVNAHARTVTAIDCVADSHLTQSHSKSSLESRRVGDTSSQKRSTNSDQRSVEGAACFILLSASEDTIVRIWRVRLEKTRNILICSSFEQLTSVIAHDMLIVGCVFVDSTADHITAVGYDSDEIAFFSAKTRR